MIPRLASWGSAWCRLFVRSSTSGPLSVMMPRMSCPLVSSRYRSRGICCAGGRGWSGGEGSSGHGLAACMAQPDEHTTLSPNVTSIRWKVDMRGEIPKPPPGKEMTRRSLGTEMTLFGRNGGETLVQTLEFVKMTWLLVNPAG